MEGRTAHVVGDIVARARRLLDVERVWLFGSQARGTDTRSSDFDIALQIGPAARARWATFVTECDDEVPALVDLDLVDLGSCDPNLADEIIATGRVVYERPR
jgi:predicted nucleotidyltransferase